MSKECDLFLYQKMDTDALGSFLNPCIKTAKAVSGTRRHHMFIPISKDGLNIYHLSSDSVCKYSGSFLSQKMA